MRLILALGNPGKKYALTRHNLGFMLADRLAEKLGAPKKQRHELYFWLAAELEGEKVVIAWPRTYMNDSGEAADNLLQEYKLTPQQMLVLVDDFALPLGSLRFRPGGSDGGHNGLASIIESLGTNQFPRLRMGIGPVDKSTEIVDFVLSPFLETELATVQQLLDRALEAMLFAITHRFDEAMSRYNSPARPESR